MDDSIGSNCPGISATVLSLVPEGLPGIGPDIYALARAHGLLRDHGHPYIQSIPVLCDNDGGRSLFYNLSFGQEPMG